MTTVFTTQSAFSAGMATRQEVILLRGIRNNWHKSKAAVLVETAFARSPMPFIIPGGEAKFANSLVEQLWSSDPGVFDGTEGHRPHPITVAASALAQGIINHSNSKVTHGTCFGALGAIIGEVRANRHAYTFNNSDLILIGLAEEILEAEAG